MEWVCPFLIQISLNRLMISAFPLSLFQIFGWGFSPGSSAHRRLIELLLGQVLLFSSSADGLEGSMAREDSNIQRWQSWTAKVNSNGPSMIQSEPTLYMWHVQPGCGHCCSLKSMKWCSHANKESTCLAVQQMLRWCSRLFGQHRKNDKSGTSHLPPMVFLRDIQKTLWWSVGCVQEITLLEL